MAQRSLRPRVVAAAGEALARQGFVTPVDVCLGLGWLHQVDVDDWRHGRVNDLDYFLPVHDDRLIDLLAYLQDWASGRRLRRAEAEYVSASRGRRPLRFLADGDPRAEAAASSPPGPSVHRLATSQPATNNREPPAAEGTSGIATAWLREQVGMTADLAR